ncbi:hypothetical protein [Kumtagia ephedrae]|jgi:hypothetical protein|uniref:Uncharacterized protein n=1 Tax=Kumtagia ephedrae TaxID=2116701 RepID=A0A2P7S500_9HYPH|nr:hypothetical protein [Mesorhizobium ephedrae]PSJ57521.1 hypothetical protein C7I84_17935 [Mesorhizobium ephedrae]
MLVSTFTALRTQGVASRTLRRATALNFNESALSAIRLPDDLPDGVTQAFWTEIVSARRAYRKKTGHNIEDVLAS